MKIFDPDWILKLVMLYNFVTRITYKDMRVISCSLLHGQKRMLHILEHTISLSRNIQCITKDFYCSPVWEQYAWGRSTRLTAKHGMYTKLPIESGDTCPFKQKTDNRGTIGSAELPLTGLSSCIISELITPKLLLCELCAKCQKSNRNAICINPSRDSVSDFSKCDH